MDQDGAISADESAPGQPNFALLLDTPLLAELVLASWCPSMDVFAAVSSDGQLRLHRLDWQLLWAISPEALITALCWRPDGKRLATGHEDGSFSVYDVESGDVLTRHKEHLRGAVLSMFWASQPDDSSSSSTDPGKAAEQHTLPSLEARHKRLFVPPPDQWQAPATNAPADPYAMLASVGAATAWPHEPEGLSLLMVANARGRLGLWMHGDMQLAEVVAAPQSQPQQQQQQRSTIHSVTATADLEHALLVQGDSEGGLMLTAHSMQLLSHHKRELQQCAAVMSHITTLLSGVEKALESAHKEWKSAMQELSKRVQQLSSSLQDHGTLSPDPQGELLCLLAAGCLSPGMHAFLTTVLGEAGLRRLARQVDGAGGEVHGQLLECVLPLVELALFLLGELHGLTRCTERLSGLGLEAQPVQQLELQCVKLLLRTEQVRLLVSRVGMQYRAFFGWLLRLVRSLESDDIAQEGAAGAAADISAFLEGQFVADAVEPQLNGMGVTPQAQALALAAVQSGIPQQECEQLLALMYKQQHQQHQQQAATDALGWANSDSAPQTLAAQLQYLLMSCEDAFNRPKDAISPTITRSLQLQLLPACQPHSTTVPQQSSRPMVQVHSANGYTLLCCHVPVVEQWRDIRASAQHEQLMLVRLQLRQHQQQQQEQQQKQQRSPQGSYTAQAFRLTLPAGTRCTDMAFYADDQLVVLVEQTGLASAGDASAGASLMLVPLSDAPFAPISVTRDAPSVLQQCHQQEQATADISAMCTRQRLLPFDSVSAPLAVSFKRGTACVLSGNGQRVAFFDLEDDESAQQDAVDDVGEDNTQSDGSQGMQEG